MHSYEDRIRAVELYYRYGKKASVVVMELGYPSTKQLGRWVRIYEEKGDLPRELKPRERYSRTQKIAAVEHYLTHGGCLSYTRRAIGYPSNEILKRWIEEFYPNARPLVIRSGTSKCFSPEERSQAVRELCNRRGTARKVAQSIGVSVPVLYKWKKDLISDEAYQSMRKRKAAPQDKNQDALLGEIQHLRKQVHQLQLERDILTKANELIKKDLGISFLKLKNREKTLIVDALKKKYPVAELLSVLQLARSCYFYRKASKRADLLVSGMTYTIHTRDGKAVSVTIKDMNGNPLDENKQYKVGMNSYIASSYRFDHADPGHEMTATSSDALIEYLKQQKEITPQQPRTSIVEE